MPHEWKYYDNGHLKLKADWSNLFLQHGLTTVSLLTKLRHDQAVKAARTDRITSQFQLDDQGTVRTFFLKWHGPAPIKDWIKPILQFKRPIIGAENEFHALQWFEQAGIASTPVVGFGKTKTESILLTEALVGYQKVSHLLEHSICSAEQQLQIAQNVALVAAHMHGAGLHHQDFYLGHLMVPTSNLLALPTVIDLGRVGKFEQLPTRWIVKDLAQLCYSARQAPVDFVRTFLAEYFQKCNRPDENTLRQRIRNKLNAIRRHDRVETTPGLEQTILSKAA